jgi:hypothetical protein
MGWGKPASNTRIVAGTFRVWSNIMFRTIECNSHSAMHPLYIKMYLSCQFCACYHRPNREQPKMLWNLLHTLANTYCSQGCWSNVQCCSRVYGCDSIPDFQSCFFIICFITSIKFYLLCIVMLTRKATVSQMNWYFCLLHRSYCKSFQDILITPNCATQCLSMHLQSLLQ